MLQCNVTVGTVRVVLTSSGDDGLPSHHTCDDFDLVVPQTHATASLSQQLNLVFNLHLFIYSI